MDDNMQIKDILIKIQKMTPDERRNIPYEELKEIIKQLTSDEIVELSNIIGYPVFTRMCMGELQHRFVLLQDGAAVIIVNEENQILMQSRADRDLWGLPGGCQELGERFEETAIREIKEETNLIVNEEDLELVAIVSGQTRKNSYPNGDVVFNNTVLYCVKKYKGELRWNEESKELRFFDIDGLPKNQNDPDLIERYVRKLKK